MCIAYIRNLKKQAQVRRKICGKFFVRDGCSTDDLYILRRRECQKNDGIQNDDELVAVWNLKRSGVSDWKLEDHYVTPEYLVLWCSASYTHPGDSSVAFYTIFCTETQWSCSPYGTTQVEKQEKRRPDL